MTILLTPKQAKTTLDWLGTLDHAKTPYRSRYLAVFARAALLLNDDLGLDAGRAATEAEALSAELLTQPVHELNLDPLLVVEHALMLKRVGESSPSLDRLCAACAEQISQLDDAMVAATPRLRLTISRLRELGHSIALPPAKVPYGKAFQDLSALLLMDNSSIVDLLDNAVADGAAIPDDSLNILALVCLGELRKYRIDFASKTARALANYRAADGLLDDVTTFIALQRTSRGKYGFADPFADDNVEEQDRDLQFHLPITLNAVWVLNALPGKRAEKAAA